MFHRDLFLTNPYSSIKSGMSATDILPSHTKKIKNMIIPVSSIYDMKPSNG